MWDTIFNRQEKTMTHTFPLNILVVVCMKTNEVSKYKDGELKDRFMDQTYCQDRHYAMLLSIQDSILKMNTICGTYSPLNQAI